MKLSDTLYKVFRKNTPQADIHSNSVVETDAKPPRNFFEKTLQSITLWAATNKKLAILVAALIVLLLSGGAYAAFSRSEPKDEMPSGVDVATNTNGTESGSNQNSTNSQTGTSTNKPSSGSSGGAAGDSTPTGAAGPIGFIGCSNIRDSVQGYADNGGDNFWVPVDDTYAGGTVVKWSNLSSEYWGEFSQFLNKYPTTKTIWWGLCTYSSDRESDAENSAAAKKVLAEIKNRIPGVTIYVSAMNDYVAPHICRLTGSDGPSRMRTLASSLVANEGLKAGPSMGSIIYYDLNTSDQQSGSPYWVNSAGATASNNQTKDDGCHPNDAGDILLGKSVLDFFGA